MIPQSSVSHVESYELLVTAGQWEAEFVLTHLYRVRRGPLPSQSVPPCSRILPTEPDSQHPRSEVVVVVPWASC